jgi:carbon-monoxide dehydrogenase medium subunit
MTPFDLAEPRTLSDAIALLDEDDPAIRPIAGGTALMLMMKAGLFRPIRLVSLRRIEPHYAEIASEPDGTLRIGAMAALSALERSRALGRHAPVVVRTLRHVANVRVRNVATVGGNLAHADPHLDLPPLWIVLGTRVVIAGPRGARTIPVEELFAGYYETTLRHDEVIAELLVPPQGDRRASYLKFTARVAHDWPTIGIAVSLALDGGRIAAPRVALGAATATPLRLGAAEAVLEGARLDEPTLLRAGEAAAAEAAIEGDDRGSASYKRELVRVHVGRAVRAAVAEAR